MTPYNDQQERLQEYSFHPPQYPHAQQPPRPARQGVKATAVTLEAVSLALTFLGIVISIASTQWAPGSIIGPLLWLAGVFCALIGFIFLCLI